MDALLLGRRIRFYRKEAGLTLDELSALVDRPTSYLSQLENGHVEARVGLLGELAESLGCTTADLLIDDSPTRRDELEISVLRAQSDPRYLELGLAEFRPTAKTSDSALEHISGLYTALVGAEDRAGHRDGDDQRRANVQMRAEMRNRNNYFAEIEAEASSSLKAAGYTGEGPPTERQMVDLAAHYGFTVARVKGMPRTARSVTDTRRRVIYIAQRDDLSVRSARSVILQTLGHFALEHAETTDFEGYLRQRIESNYFAAAVLVPEAAAVDFLTAARDQRDLSIEDLKERYYVSYEMAAHRFTNLATVRLGVAVHFIRTDPEGTVTKAYENDGIEFPTDADGGLEGARLGRRWGARQAWDGSDLLHYQLTDTDQGEFWCVTYVENATERTPYAVTLGCRAADAGLFRGGGTLRRVSGRREDDRVQPEALRRWDGVAWPSASERSFILTALPSASREFTPFPGIDLLDVYRFLDRQA